jgi:hypothetical protein
LGNHLTPPVPKRRFVTDFWEHAKLGGLGLIFLRHSPEFGSDFSARRYPRVTGAKSRKLDQLVIGQSSHRSSALGNSELNGRSSRCDADHPLDLYSLRSRMPKPLHQSVRGSEGTLSINESALCAKSAFPRPLSKVLVDALRRRGCRIFLT